MIRFYVRTFLSLLTLLLLVVPVCADDAYDKVRSEFRKLQNSSKQQLYRHNWERVIEGLEQFQRNDQDHPQAASALFLAGRASHDLYRISGVRKDAVSAVKMFDRVHDLYPASSLADDAMLMAGEVLEDPLQRFEEAYRRFSSIVTLYPKGDMFGKAREGAKRLAAHAPKRPTVAAPSRPVAEPGAARLENIRHRDEGDFARVVLDLTGPVGFKANTLPADTSRGFGPRLYVDLEQVQASERLPDRFVMPGRLLQGIRTGHPTSSRLRVVLDLASLKDFRVSQIDRPDRLVIDVFAEGVEDVDEVEVPVSGADSIGAMLSSVPNEPDLAINIPDSTLSKGLRRIVVDAGHGGKDPGAVGPNGLKEKTVTLAMAKKIAAELKKAFKCEVLLTRDDDTFIPLAERTQFANRKNADLFISVHANASRSRSVYGVETFYLNFSKNRQAVAVAARENGMSLKEVGDLELILFDLMANAKINESSRLASEMQKSLVSDLRQKYSRIKDLGVKQGPFHVLLGATMPSVLVETAFISNRREESRLKDSAYQQQVAKAVVKGVRNYARAFKLIATK
ncbi:MAG: N-acetylmuramoyl-L-alanine amidase [Desulfuromonas sp.]|nr:MAG: N-acetylmuramoyl-L-alanine amidase [Desulfuromonas sp.]